jgi:hypothetical protein
MAAGDSVVSICNIALIALGEDPITSLADNTKRAILCNARYDDIRRAVLRGHTWNCNRKQAKLAADPIPPLFTRSYRYRLPGDYMRMYNLPENDMSVWDVFSDGTAQFLHTDETSPLDVVYGFDLQDATQFDPLLAHTIGYQIAVELCNPLTQSTERLKTVEAIFEGKIAISRLVGSQENSPREWDEDILLRSRR